MGQSGSRERADQLNLHSISQSPADLRLSVVIPTLNESQSIASTIESVRRAVVSPVEIIVVDGGSNDGTPMKARSLGAKVLQSERGRGKQQNAGWQAARGEWCLFLHADSQLPPHYDQLIASAIQAGRLRGGASSTGQQQPGYWQCLFLLAAGVELRTRLRHQPYGDQALFVRRDVLQATGGYKEWPLLEDLDLVQRLRQAGPPVIVDAPVFTSGRRWRDVGFFRTALINQGILLAFAAGVPPETLAGWYRKAKHQMLLSQ
eukprot:XP_001689768.1 predicted protein [Chlamydomonas reinhardtii]